MQAVCRSIPNQGVYTDKWTFKSCLIELNLDCSFTFPIALAPDGNIYSIKSIGKVYLSSRLGFIQQDSNLDSSVN